MISRASNFAGPVDDTFLFILGFSVIVLLLITLVMIYFLFKYNHRRHVKVANIEGNVVLELTWTIVPTIIFMGMFYVGYRGFLEMRTVPADADQIVQVTGQRWSWMFEYADGTQTAQLAVRLGKPVVLELYSKDVIHSFYVPEFRVKEDLVPGKKDQWLWFTPTQEGTFDIFCTEYCGDRHSYMLSKVLVMNDEDYRTWFRQAKEDFKKNRGKQLFELKGGCASCHSLDDSPLVGPSLKGVWGRTSTVITNGAERQIQVDTDYLRKSMLEPNADVVKGFIPVMPSKKGELSDEEITAIIQYLKEKP